MRLHVLSDTHLEYAASRQEIDVFFSLLKKRAEAESPDVLVVAGDICPVANKELFVPSMEAFKSMYKHVVFVPGNHEYWGSDILPSAEDSADDVMYSLQGSNFSVLSPGYTAKIKGWTFAGGTLWYPHPEGQWRNSNGRIMFSDFVRIKNADPEIFRRHVNFCDSNFDQADVVVTHHFPTDESIQEKWKLYKNNVFFCANLDSILAQRAPKRIWIHGHTHNPMDYMSKFGFRVYCNPFGSPWENYNEDFWSRLCIDL